MTVYTDSGTVRVKITPSGVDVKTGSFTDAATVLVDIQPSGVEVKTGSGVDAATIYVDIRVAQLAEGDIAYSAATTVTVGTVPPTVPVPGDPEPTVPTVPDVEPVPQPSYNGPDDSDHGSFIGEGLLLHARFVASPNAAFNRFEGKEFNRFTGVLRV